MVGIGYLGRRLPRSLAPSGLHSGLSRQTLRVWVRGWIPPLSPSLTSDEEAPVGCGDTLRSASAEPIAPACRPPPVSVAALAEREREKKSPTQLRVTSFGGLCRRNAGRSKGVRGGLNRIAGWLRSER